LKGFIFLKKQIKDILQSEAELVVVWLCSLVRADSFKSSKFYSPKQNSLSCIPPLC